MIGIQTSPTDTSTPTAKTILPPLEPSQKPAYMEAALEQRTSRVAQGAARVKLSQGVALLIERWDYMTPE